MYAISSTIVNVYLLLAESQWNVMAPPLYLTQYGITQHHSYKNLKMGVVCPAYF
jgi:hypothetical protein